MKLLHFCFQTLGQSNCVSWYEERSRRITASLFGKVMKRKQSIHPTSIIKLMLEKHRKYGCTPTSLTWGIENESVAVQNYKQLYINGSFDVRDCGFVVNP